LRISDCELTQLLIADCRLGISTQQSRDGVNQQSAIRNGVNQQSAISNPQFA
jgi:hypothetical protein